MSDAELLVMEVTGLSRDEARDLVALRGGGSAEVALAYFFESAAAASPPPSRPAVSATAAPAQCRGGGSSSAEAAMRAAAAQSCGRGAPIAVEAHLAYGAAAAPLLLTGLHAEDTVQTLKQLIATASDVPAVAQKIVYEGRCLLQVETTLAAAGMRGPCASVAVLFQDRSEDGTVHVVMMDAFGSATPLFDLTEGEWNVSTSIRTIRARAASAHAELPGRGCGSTGHTRRENQAWIIVHNALRLDDASTFGQNGIRSGSTITILEHDN